MKHNPNAFRWCHNKSAGYLTACVSVFFAFCVRFALQPQIEAAMPLFFFQINTIVIAFYFGTGPALLTVALSIPLISYFFMAPFGEFSVVDARDVSTLIVYGTYTALVCFLVERLRREQYNAKMAILVSESRFKLMVEGDAKIRDLIKNSPPSNLTSHRI
jgi:K+-sensing histidine kinase KdpD